MLSANSVVIIPANPPFACTPDPVAWTVPLSADVLNHPAPQKAALENPLWVIFFFITLFLNRKQKKYQEDQSQIQECPWSLSVWSSRQPMEFESILPLSSPHSRRFCNGRKHYSLLSREARRDSSFSFSPHCFYCIFSALISSLTILLSSHHRNGPKPE